MIKTLRILLSSLLLIVFLLSSVELSARIKESKGDKGKDEIQRTPTLLFDNQYNTVSNIKFPVMNNGIFALDKAKNEGGGYWPRGSQNQYIFGGGIWFGAVRNRRDTAIDKKYVEVTYNPNSGGSWFVPGRIEDGDNVVEDDIKKYRCYFSTDFSVSTGEPRDKNDGQNWPIWDSSNNLSDTLKKNRYFGRYILETNDRNTNVYKKGPAIISGEDIFTTFKDTDMQYFEGGATKRKNEGYPLRLQIEHTIYSWGFGDYRDFIFLRYDIINFSNDTLRSCWLAPVMDVDIARAPQVQFGAGNDRVRFYEEDPALNMAFQWTNNDRGEANRGFGYLGFDFLESPAVYKFFRYDTTIVENPNTGQKDTTIEKTEIIKPETNFVRKDSAFYDASSQLGLVTFRNWPIEIDPQGDEERYDFMALGQREGDTGPGDKRFMMATGPFHIRPKDTVRTVVAIILANTGLGADATGEPEDLTLLIARDKFAQRVYDNNFQAPAPPDLTSFVDPDNPSLVPPVIKFKPLNHAVELKWQEIAELSNDLYERGLDFMGYKLYRARVSNLDTFNVDEISAGNQYTKGAGAFGWRQIGRWEIPTPYQKSSNTAGFGPTEIPNLRIDSLKIVNLVPDPNNWLTGYNEFAIQVMNVAKGVEILPDSQACNYNYNTTPNPKPKDAVVSPVITLIDTGFVNQPWANFYKSVSQDLQLNIKTYPVPPKHYLFDSVLIGTIYLNTANLDFNPLYYKRNTARTTADILSKLPAKGIYYRDTVQKDNDGKPIPGTEMKVIDSIYQIASFRSETVSGSNMYFIDVLKPRKIDEILTDVPHIRECLDSVYTFIQKGYIRKFDLPDFASSWRAKTEVINPYVATITNNRSFVDIGDNNGDGVITYDADPTLTEKLINNVEYFYKIVAYDEGDFLQPTPTKQNDAADKQNPNFAQTYAFAPPPMDLPTFEITHVDSSLIGGLYNFKFFSLNNQRVMQLFAGHEFELTFEPHWNLSSVPLNSHTENPNDDKTAEINLYHKLMKIKDLTTNEDVFQAYTYFETEPCEIRYRGAFTENAASYVLADIPIIDTIANQAITFGMPYDIGKQQRGGTITTGDYTTPGYCYTYGFSSKAIGNIGFSFDYSMVQFGGRYRGDSTTAKINGDAVTPVTILDTGYVFTTRQVDYVASDYQWDQNRGIFMPMGAPVYGSYNNGPSNLVLGFEDGGVETMTLKWGTRTNNKTNTFNVRYLVPVVKETIKFNRPKETDPMDSVEVKYTDAKWPHMDLPVTTSYQTQTMFPDLSLLVNSNEFIGKFNVAAHGFVNGRRENGAGRIARQVAKPTTVEFDSVDYINIGTQGRYYLTAISTDGVDTLDFAHVLTANGVPFALDYANKARRLKNTAEWGVDGYSVPLEQYTYGQDFEPGDEVLLKTFGGALGLPMAGAKVRFKINASSTQNSALTDEQLGQVGIVPNPYYISHQGQKSPYDAKIYFTRLPKSCTIEIYTANGDLVQTIQHDENKSFAPDKVAIDTWNLLSSNQQRVKSQIFVAIIRTPDGAETTKEFSVIVGSTRVIQD